MAAPMRLGDKLVKDGLISPDQLRIALHEQRISGKKLGEVIVYLGFMTEAQAREVLGEATGYDSISLKGVVPDISALSLLDEPFARANKVIPISIQDDLVKVAMSNPDDILLLDKIKRNLKKADINVKPLLVAESEIQNAIDQFYGYELSIDGIIHELETGKVDIRLLAETDEYSQPIVRLVDSILTDAVKRGASDIHFEPEEFYVRIRYRIDGVLQEVRLLHKSFWPGLVVRLKVIANLDLTDQRLPQDGHMDLLVMGRRVDFRVSSLPGTHGENFVLRILDREKGIVPLAKLGLDDESFRMVQLMLNRPNGIFLVTGPTGSGKTTTLYSIMNEQNDIGVNIMTLEDPVEYPMTLIRQTAVNPEVGLTFARGVRALLRQDPDIILIGEIRDSETAEMAFRAAMTGHQVFASLHTNSAIGAIPRLLDIGISPSILAGNIIGILAQRLARRLCKHCKTPYQPDDFESQLIGFTAQETKRVLYKASGCEHCNGVGYKGRLAVLETLRFTKEIDNLLLESAPTSHILALARKQGFKTLAESAVAWVKNGETTLEEINRIVDLSELI
ncbi:ATPase, T2SS/T4P/T4SS family [Thiomicrospira sp. R3]|uniref:GspE/PulE family protein n=1 Tax=Thiomicrospira sp. R3 TaxID=3035472 RepID=UPI00259B2E4C|nr:type II/IV secretion system protein [Thiomicrospira sp. R3]WFE68680.1 ATPase, T2SS/T4P/T4SS family [Thiomicrospira sp. R3]